jgi:hypothetical protein
MGAAVEDPMTERLTLRDRWEDLRQRTRALHATISLCRALGRRGRNGIWVFWTSLEPAEQERYVHFIRVCLQRCWHIARDPDVPLPWQPTAEDLLRLLGSATWSGPVVRGSGDFLKDMGHEDPDGVRIRVELANRISVAIEAIARAHAARVCGMTPDRVARIERGDVEEMPVAELQRLVAKLESETSK